MKRFLRVLGWILFGYFIGGAIYVFYVGTILESLVILPLIYLGWWLAHRR